MNPNPNFTPLQLLKKETNESDYNFESSIVQPNPLVSSMGKSPKNEDNPSIPNSNHPTHVKFFLRIPCFSINKYNN